MSEQRLPRWVRALLALDRGVESWHRSEIRIVERLMCVIVDPAQRDAITLEMYSRQHQYLPGSPWYENGLYHWEEVALTNPPFPPNGRVLVGAAGGGREMVALCERGYAVTAFEPSTALVEGARVVASRFPGTAVVQATYQDLVGHAAGRRTPFGDLLDEPFDAVILGWGSVSHVIELAERVALFCALRCIAPKAPVLVSYNMAGNGSTGVPGARTRLVRSLLSRVGVHTPEPAPGLGFSSTYGFRHVFAEDEIERLAADTGYVVARAAVRAFPHAVLTPVS